MIFEITMHQLDKDKSRSENIVTCPAIDSCLEDQERILQLVSPAVEFNQRTCLDSLSLRQKCNKQYPQILRARST